MNANYRLSMAEYGLMRSFSRWYGWNTRRASDVHDQLTSLRLEYMRRAMGCNTAGAVRHNVEAVHVQGRELLASEVY